MGRKGGGGRGVVVEVGRQRRKEGGCGWGRRVGAVDLEVVVVVIVGVCFDRE